MSNLSKIRKLFVIPRKVRLYDRRNQNVSPQTGNNSQSHGDSDFVTRAGDASEEPFSVLSSNIDSSVSQQTTNSSVTRAEDGTNSFTKMRKLMLNALPQTESCSPSQGDLACPSVTWAEDALEQPGSDFSSQIDSWVLPQTTRLSDLSTNQPDPQLGMRFCIWVALKFENLGNQASRNLVSRTFIGNNWFALYWESLEQLKKVGVMVTSESVRALMRAYVRIGLVENALESFGRMRELDCQPDVHAYNTILRALMHKGSFLLMLALYNQMLKSNLSPNDLTLNMLVNVFCKCGRTKEALEMLDEMSYRELSPNSVTFTAVLSGICQNKKVDDALRLFNVMKEKGFQPDLVSYNVLIDGFGKVGRLDEAFSILRLLERDGHALGLKGYSSLINCLFRARRFNEAFSWYTKMFKEGITPDVVLYTIMIRGLSEEGRVGEGVMLLNEMTQEGLVPDAYCYNAVIKGFCSIGLLDEAQSLQLEISEHDGFANACTHTILISGMCRNGMVGEAQQIFSLMEKLGCFPSVVTFNALINGLCKAGKHEEAHLLFYKMEIGRNPSLYLRLSQGANPVVDSVSLQKKVEQMCETGEILNAYKLLNQLDTGVTPDIVTYNILINSFCKAGNINGAFSLFKDLQLRGLSPDSVTYGTLIDGFYRANREEDAFRIYEHMLHHGCKPSIAVYKALMTWLCRKGKILLAFSLWLEYINNRSGLEDDSKKIEALKEYFDGGEVVKAIRGLLELDLKFKDFDLAPYTILLIGLCQANRVDDALMIFSVLDKFNINVNPPSCAFLIESLCVEGKVDKAVDIFLYALDRGFLLGPRYCNRILICLFHSKKEKDAIYLVKRMKSLGYSLRSSHYCRTRYLLEEHQHRKAKERVIKMSKEIMLNESHCLALQHHAGKDNRKE